MKYKTKSTPLPQYNKPLWCYFFNFFILKYRLIISLFCFTSQYDPHFSISKQNEIILLLHQTEDKCPYKKMSYTFHNWFGVGGNLSLFHFQFKFFALWSQNPVEYISIQMTLMDIYNIFSLNWRKIKKNIAFIVNNGYQTIIVHSDFTHKFSYGDET